MKLLINPVPDILIVEFIPYSAFDNVITCASNSRDLSNKINRVRSSNLWGTNIDVKNNGDTTGDVIIQFKSKYGGPGDVYMYMDVPIIVYRRLIVAPSKGHFFWKYIRNRYKYRKLTGDKRGKLPNAIN